MRIDGTVHCFFEQSGVFKDAFNAVGLTALDYDIANRYGRTDHVMDLFKEIDNAYLGQESVFDDMTQDDLIMAFYPCIYFCQMSQFAQSLNYTNYRAITQAEACDRIIKRQMKRDEYLVRLTKFVRVCLARNLRMIFENPITGSFLCNYFLKPPTLNDNNRMMRGDYFVKPTGYWFWNCEPTDGCTVQMDKVKRRVNDAPRPKHPGVCSEERSAISPDYARNFIADFILGDAYTKCGGCGASVLIHENNEVDSRYYCKDCIDTAIYEADRAEGWC
jgi:hypothetical protein